MEESAGIYRTETALKEATGKLKGLHERFRALSLADDSYTFNTELTARPSNCRPPSRSPSRATARGRETNKIDSPRNHTASPTPTIRHTQRIFES